MTIRKLKNTFIISSLLLIIVVMAFTGILNVMSFQKNYTNSLVSSYAVSGDEIVRKIEYAVKYGKPLSNFYGIEKMLSEKVDLTEDLKDLRVISPEGVVIYDRSGRAFNKSIPSELIPINNFEDKKSTYKFDLYKNEYYVFLPILDAKKNWIGSIELVFDESIIISKMAPYKMKLIQYLLILAAISVLLLILFTSKLSIIKNNNEINKKGITAVLLIILSVVQIIYGILNYQLFRQAYLDITKENTLFTSVLVKKDIDSIIKKGVPYNSLYGINDYLYKITQSIPEINKIEIKSDDNVVFQSSEEKVDNVSNDFKYNLNLHSDVLGQKAKVNVVLSEDYIKKKLLDIILDMATILITSFLFMVEVALFVIYMFRKKISKNDEKTVVNENINDDIPMIRPLTFIFAMSIFMSVSFIPLVMKELYEPIFGLSKNIVLGLPISVEMLFGGVFTLLAGNLVDKRGWKPLFLVGLLFFILGTFLSAIATEAFLFIIARAIVGAGYGCGLMATRTFVNNAKSEKVRTEGFSALVSGLYAGVNCGVIVGAMLADRIGFSNVFFIAMFIAIVACIFAFFLMENSFSNEKVKKTADTKSSKPSSFIGNKAVLSFFIFIIIPTTICSMFLDFYFPVFAESIGVSSSNIGRAFLLNGLCVVYLGPILSYYTEKVFGVKFSVVLSVLCIVGGMLIFTVQGTLIAAFIAVILLGISDSFGLVAQNNYFVNLKATNDVGVGKALGYYDNVRKLGQMVGPMVFGGIAFLGKNGIGLIGFITLALLILFLVSAKDKNNSMFYRNDTGVDA